ncbi:hypothetical protein ACS0TY_029726 [Phlomoides rotata]
MTLPQGTYKMGCHIMHIIRFISRLAKGSLAQMGGTQKICISHLQYADDTIFICDGEVSNLRVIKRILRLFELASGLKVNFSKSQLFGINLAEDRLHEAAAILGGGSTKERKDGSIWWRDLCQLYWGSNGDGVNREFSRVLGDGKNTGFWDDVWVEGDCLRERFGRLFRLSGQKELAIGEMGDWVNGVWEWEFNWSRPLSARNLGAFNELLNILGRYTLSTGRDDCWKWKYSSNGIYVVKKAYDLRMERRGDAREVEQETSLFKKLWKSWAVRKAVVTSWKLLKGKMATTDNLGRRGITLNNEEKKCQFCLEEEESIRHIFFECKVSSSIWESILRWLGVSMVLHIDPKIHFLHFGECLGSGTKATVARTIWIGTVWSLWNTRNDIVFNKATFNADRESSKIKISVWNWISALDQRLLDLNLRNWLGDPTKCLEIM